MQVVGRRTATQLEPKDGRRPYLEAVGDQTVEPSSGCTCPSALAGGVGPGLRGRVRIGGRAAGVLESGPDSGHR